MPAPGYLRPQGLLPALDTLEAPYGYRQNGTPKGRGWMGELQRPDGYVSTELSIGTEIDGVPQDVPLITPNQGFRDMNQLLSQQPGAPLPRGMAGKAIDHAITQMKRGRSPYKD